MTILSAERGSIEFGQQVNNKLELSIERKKLLKYNALQIITGYLINFSTENESNWNNYAENLKAYSDTNKIAIEKKIFRRRKVCSKFY
ncbi:hypothetical protein HY844_01575 [Candidatus Berkelbacteria bacterium]|nr:hypothetical protein [Candidatus Berkelbacteria bacterium]